MPVMRKTIKKRVFRKKPRKLPFAVRGLGNPVQFKATKELKQVDLLATNNVISTSFNSQRFTDLVQGTEVCNRIGRQVTYVSLEIRGCIERTAQAVAADVLRIFVVYDLQGDGSAPAAADIMQSINAASATSTDPFAFPNSGNWDRFKILADWFIPMQSLQNSGDIQSVQGPMNIHRYIKLRPLKGRWAGGSNACTTGSLYLFTMGTIANSSAPYQLTYGARLKYHDD